MKLKLKLKHLKRGACLRLNDGVVVAVARIGGTGCPIVGFPRMGGVCPVDRADIAEILDPDRLSLEDASDYKTAMWSVERYG